MLARFICQSLITKLNRQLKLPYHLNICRLRNSAHNCTATVFSDRFIRKAIDQPLSIDDPVHITGVPFTASLLCRTQNYTISICRRNKHGKSKKTYQADDEDENERDFMIDQDDGSIGGKEVTVNVASLRLDQVVKAGFGLSKTKAEEYFYQSRIRVNGEKVMKKGNQVSLGDEIDVIRGINSNTDKYIDVMRLHIIGFKLPKESQGTIQLKVKRDKFLTTENYEKAWSGEYIT